MTLESIECVLLQTLDDIQTRHWSLPVLLLMNELFHPYSNLLAINFDKG